MLHSIPSVSGYVRAVQTIRVPEFVGERRVSPPSVLLFRQVPALVNGPSGGFQKKGPVSSNSPATCTDQGGSEVDVQQSSLLPSGCWDTLHGQEETAGS